MASSTDTSESEDSGPHDNRHAHTQNLPSVQRSALCAVLPWPRVVLATTHQEPDQAQAGNARTVSPCGTHHPDCQQWLVSQQGALAHNHSSTNVLKRQASAPAGGANSSPCLKPGDSLARQVEKALYILEKSTLNPL